MTVITENLQAVRQSIRDAALSCDRDPGSVTLVAVSKRHSPEAIRTAYAAGQRDFGENYAQEQSDKALELADLEGIRWHFIGHLQRNKAKHVAPSCALVETVDSARLVEELSRQAVKLDRVVSCLVQVNVGEEDQKFGCDREELEEILCAVEEADGLALEGLMTIPPWDLEPQETRVHFRALSQLRERHGGRARLPHLSMGMSHDFQVAIEEGATMVRVGTAIFGPRT